MTKERPRLSILIPSKNRYEFLLYSLRAVLKYYDVPQVEIIVHDNSDDVMSKELKELISSSSSIRYVKIDDWMSGKENFERTVALSSGKYITMIGDDDSLTPFLLNAIKWMDENECDALYTPFITYLWPGIHSKLLGSKLSGQIKTPKYKGKLTWIDSQKEVLSCLRLGGTNMQGLPRMYYGIVKRDVLERIKEASGFYIPGPSPDMANAVSVGLFCKKSCHYDYPLFIAGNSNKSTAGMGASGKHVGKLEEIKLLPLECAQEWSELIPRFWSGPTIWSESCHKAITQTENSEYLVEFNYLRIYAKSLVYHSDWKEEIIDTLRLYCKTKRKSYWVSRIKIVSYQIVEWKSRFVALLNNMTSFLLKTLNKNDSITTAHNVYEATEMSIKNLDKTRNPLGF